MKITKSRLKEIIKEEYSNIIIEAPIGGEPVPYDYVVPMSGIVSSMGKLGALLRDNPNMPVGDDHIERYLRPMISRFVDIFTSRPELQALLNEKGVSVPPPETSLEQDQGGGRPELEDFDL